MTRKSVPPRTLSLNPVRAIRDGSIIASTAKEFAVKIPIKAIEPNPYQPRTGPVTNIAELANSIREHGLIQPIVVATAGEGKYTLIVGSRRLKACQRLGWDEIPAIVKTLSPERSERQLVEMAVVENVQRDNLNAAEVVAALAKLKELHGTDQMVAQVLGWTIPVTKQWLRLRHLGEKVLEVMATSDQTNQNKLRELAEVKDPGARLRHAKQFVKRAAGQQQLRSYTAHHDDTERPQVEPPPPKPIFRRAYETSGQCDGVEWVLSIRIPANVSDVSPDWVRKVVNSLELGN